MSSSSNSKSCCESACWTFLKSSVGKKLVMGVTGLMLSGFVFAHMAGNMLIIFSGPDAYNLYGHGITSNPLYPLISYGLLAIFIVHVLTAISLIIDNKKARPISYTAGSTKGDKRVSLASRTMAYSGSLLAAFLVSHLITFKYGAYYTTTIDGREVRDLAKLLYEVFQNPGYVAWYVVSLLLLATHLKHGFAAAFQSVGFWHPRYTPFIKSGAVLYALVVSFGFISQPLYVFLKH
jgi:succinate dehydrogenase / fumarate reductase cytochrome b subunit